MVNHNNSINKVLSSNVKARFTSKLYENTRHRVSHILINLLASKQRQKYVEIVVYDTYFLSEGGKYINNL